MKATNYLALGILSSYLQGLSLADDPKQKGFDSVRCPWYYLRQNFVDPPSAKKYAYELVATCSNSSSDPTISYITSVLDLDRCLTNKKGALALSTGDGSAGFSDTCRSCGLINMGPYIDQPGESKPVLTCQCGDEDPSRPAKDTSFYFEWGIWVDPKGVISCLNGDSNVLPYSNSSTPKMIPPNLAAAAAAAAPSTVTSTVVQNNTVTVSAVASNNATVVSTAMETTTAVTTATATLVSTVQPSCPSQAPVTVTRTKRKKAKTVTTTTTTTSISTSLVKYLVGTSAGGNGLGGRDALQTPEPSWEEESGI
ncbi:hypothetical protein F4811DRAFT_500741 [Daldinia bambusicola]|nr:hypothetical protein F4811DRAFT_500741 [Daldinia bambusicola]